MPRSNSTVNFNSYDLLKLVALAAMTLDHAGQFVWQEEWLRVAGRVAAPLFCFLVGFNGSYRFRRELLLAAGAMSVVDVLARGTLLPLNILWVILLVRFVLAWLDAHATAVWLLIGSCLLWLPVTLLLTEYGTLVLLWALWGRAVRRGEKESGLYYGAVAMIVTAVYALLGFAWSTVQFVVAAELLLVVFFCLQRFKVMPIKRYRVPALRWLSRHALWYYVAHRAVLMAVGAVVVV